MLPEAHWHGRLPGCRPQQAANATAAVRKGQARARRSRPSALCTTAQPRASRVAQPGESAAAGVSQPTPAAPVPEGASGAQPSSVPGSSEPQNPPAGRRERVAAYLSKNGLDPEALQREQPEAFGLLTMPLARARECWVALLVLLSSVWASRPHRRMCSCLGSEWCSW